MYHSAINWFRFPKTSHANILLPNILLFDLQLMLLHSVTVYDMRLTAFGEYGCVRKTRNFNTTGVNRACLQSCRTPRTHNQGVHGATVDHQLRVGYRHRSLHISIKDPGVRCVQECLRKWRRLRHTYNIPSYVGDEAIDVRAYVVSPEGVKVPVGFNRSQLRIVRVERGVLGADEFRRNC